MPRGQADGDVIVDVLLNTKKAEKYWQDFTNFVDLKSRQLENKLSASAKKIETLTERRTSSKGLVKKLEEEQEIIGQRLDAYSFALKQAREKLKQWQEIEEYLNSGGSKDPTYFMKQYALQTELGTEEEITKEIAKQEGLLQRNIEKYDALTARIQEQKKKTKSINQDLTQEKNNFSEMNQRYIELNRNGAIQNRNARETAKNTKETANNTKGIHFNTQNIKRDTGKINANLKSGIGHLGQGIKKIIRMSLALIGVRSIYTGISSALTTWMNSEDELAKQTKANLDNLKMNIASILQPALQWVINAFNNILGLIGAIVKQFTKLNIFANKTANSTNKISKSASDTLASFDKIDVLKQDTGDSGEGQVEPIDMTSFVNKYEKLAEEIKEIFATIFDPIKKAWENKGQDVIDTVKKSFENLAGLGESVGSSIFRVWTNGTGQKTIETLLGIFKNLIAVIGNVATAWKNAWEKNDVGTQIVQNLWDALNNVLEILETLSGVWEKVSSGEGYQKFVEIVTEAVNVTSEAVKIVTEAWKEMFDEHGEEWAENFDKIFKNIGEILEPIVNFIKKVVENEEFQEYFKSYVDILGDGVTFLTDWVILLTDLLKLIADPNWKNLKDLGEDLQKITGTAVEKEKSSSKVKKTIKSTILNTIRSVGGPATFIPTTTVDIASRLFGNKEEVAEKTKKIFETIKRVIKESIPNIFANIMKDLAPRLTSVVKAVETILPEIKEVFNRLKEQVPKIVEAMGTEIKTKFELLKTEVTTKFEVLKTSIVTKWELIKTTVVRIVETIKAEVLGKFEILKTEATTKTELLKTAITTKWETMKNSIVRFAETIKTEVTTKFETLKNTITTKFETIKKNVTGTWETIRSTVVDKVNNIKSNIENKFNALKENISTTWETIKNTLVNKVEGIKTTIVDRFETIKKRIGEKVWDVVNAIKTPFENVGASIANALDTAWWNIKNALNTIIEGVETMINRVSSQLNKFTKNTIGATLSTGALGGILQLFGIKTSGGGTNFQPIYIPRLAKGGITTQATPAIIGEAGKEAVLPLEQNTEWMDSLADKISAGLNVGINFTGSLSQLAQVLKPEIDKENRRIGDSLIKGGVM